MPYGLFLGATRRKVRKNGTTSVWPGFTGATSHSSSMKWAFVVVQ